MNRKDFIDWAANNDLQDAYQIGDTCSDIPETLGILTKDGMYHIYRVDERGTPKPIIAVSDEEEAYERLQTYLNAELLRYADYQKKLAAAAQKVEEKDLQNSAKAQKYAAAKYPRSRSILNAQKCGKKAPSAKHMSHTQKSEDENSVFAVANA